MEKCRVCLTETHHSSLVMNSCFLISAHRKHFVWGTETMKYCWCCLRDLSRVRQWDIFHNGSKVWSPWRWVTWSCSHNVYTWPIWKCGLSCRGGEAGAVKIILHSSFHVHIYLFVVYRVWAQVWSASLYLSSFSFISWTLPASTISLSRPFYVLTLLYRKLNFF